MSCQLRILQYSMHVIIFMHVMTSMHPDGHVMVQFVCIVCIVSVDPDTDSVFKES